MIETNMSWDLLPLVDVKVYAAWAKKAGETMAKQPGMIEFRASRNMLGNPQIRISLMWKSLADWAKFAEGEVWGAVNTELRSYATNFRIELWGPSPVIAEPIRPAK
jgi:hypothetical protein